VTENKPLSVFIYVTHLLGSGHLSRALAIAQACHDDGMVVTLATGGFPTHKLKDRAFRIVQLPPCRIKGTDFLTLFDEYYQVVDEEWKIGRAKELETAFKDASPDVIITELFPLGRRQMTFELDPLLDACKIARPKPMVFCSVRDILQPPSKQKKITRAEQYLEDYYGGLLVHGDPRIATLGQSFPMKAEVLALAQYTGFIFDGEKPEENKERNQEIIVSAGGGAAGESLYRIAAEASQLGPDGFVWHLLIGRGLPQEFFEEITSKAHANLIVEWARSDFPDLLASAALSISQAGYNTMLDIVNADVNSITVPFSDGGEVEQNLRAKLFEKAGYTTVVKSEELSAAKLLLSVTEVLNAPKQERLPLNLEGGKGTVETIKTLWNSRTHNV
jgi:predicted glycosyltransferase